MKAVLVVEMPTSCSMCWLDSICKVWQDEPTKWKGFNDRLDGCPLKPMPDKAAEVLSNGLDAMMKMQSVEVRTVRIKE